MQCTILVVLSGAQVGSIHEKFVKKSRDTATLIKQSQQQRDIKIHAVQATKNMGSDFF